MPDEKPNTPPPAPVNQDRTADDPPASPSNQDMTRGVTEKPVSPVNLFVTNTRKGIPKPPQKNDNVS
jgi:hypothetical protein